MISHLVAIAVAIGTLVVLGVLALGLYCGLEALAGRALQRCRAGLEVHDEPWPGDVAVTYHTYHGLIVWFTQTEHRVYLPPDDAYRLLDRFLRFNLAWGLPSLGAFFVLTLSIWNYFAQRRSIRSQTATRPH